jgi:hypothetical protein
VFRIINLTNPDTSLKALPGLYDIARELDLSNIKRLTTPKDRLNVAYNIAEIVFKNINEHKNEDKSSEKGEGLSADSGIGAPSDNSDQSNTNADVADILGGTESTVTPDNKDVTADIGKDDNLSKSKKLKKSLSQKE